LAERTFSLLAKMILFHIYDVITEVSTKFQINGNGANM